MSRYNLGKLLGKGGYSSVFDATTKPAGDGIPALVAVKALDTAQLKKKMGRASRVERGIMSEIAVMKACGHPNIIQLFEVILDPLADRIFLVMERLSGGVVMAPRNLPKGKACHTEAEARFIFQDLVCGLSYLHGHGILHPL